MGSELKYDRGTQWLIAIGISLALHAGGLLLLATWHAADAASARPSNDERPEQAEVTEAKPEEKESAPEVAKPVEPKPVEPKPVVKPAEQKPAEPKESVKPVAEDDSGNKAKPSPETHVVKKGETLSSIAKACGCTIAELAKLNGGSLKKLSNLRVGQRIKVPHGN